MLDTMPEGQPYWKYRPNPDNVKPKPIQQKIRKFISTVDTRLPQIKDATKHRKESPQLVKDTVYCSKFAKLNNSLEAKLETFKSCQGSFTFESDVEPIKNEAHVEKSIDSIY